MSVYRFVVCVDVDADTLDEAYEALQRNMPSNRAAMSGVEWETTEEWFDPDSEEPGDPERLEAARKKYFAKRTQ